MNSEFMFQIKTISDEFHTILTLKEFNVSVETFFNELQKVKYRIKSKISIDFAAKAGIRQYFNKEGILMYGIGHQVKIEYSWYNTKNKYCKNFMLFYTTA